MTRQHLELPASVQSEIRRQASNLPEVILPEDRDAFMAEVDDPARATEAENHWSVVVDANESEHRRLRQRERAVQPGTGKPDSVRIAVSKGGGLGSGESILLEILSSVNLLHEKVDSHPSPMADGWMSTKQAAAYLMWTPRGVRVAAEEGRLPGHKNSASRSRGNRWRFKKSELDKFMRLQKRKTPESEISIWQ